ncbi:hypothetical protein EJ05DRAFT_507521 [Pseudovirgaria hyperparasitica]|uniref:F-box domain-containing protein n=1 Tax=Pseudovirgaria hyperparasitica TaxID=470096 RepID=A0A6A6WIN7_9PEZI|nr:uncharacterized protein EJ05DRAFT_507521 [Pseudovirgaria hyperparasitica]KAF2761906.1 hypothetical protein EJ05DRAFT_507521 [Pseudovirgaria hyperparasitica]
MGNASAPKIIIRPCLEMLPFEILEEIYKHLGTIDDAHHLARTCKRINQVMDLDGVYKRIMGMIIVPYTYIKSYKTNKYQVNSKVHRFDKQLCNLLVAHHHILEHFTENGIFPQCKDPSLPTSDQGPDPGAVDLSRATCPSWKSPEYEWRITDTEIFDILARWQGLREIQHLYTKQTASKMSYLNPWMWGQHDELQLAALHRHYIYITNMGFEGVRVDALPNRDTHMDSFDAEQTDRFYVALTLNWVLQQHRWCLISLNCATPMIAEKAKSAFEAMLQHDEARWGKRSLLDELDLLEVYEFLYHAMLPVAFRVLHGDGQTSGIGRTRVGQQAYEVSAGRLLRRRLQTKMAMFQPPDIVEAILLAQHTGPVMEYDDALQSPRATFNSTTLSAAWRPGMVTYRHESFGFLPSGTILSMGNRGARRPEVLGDMHYLYLSETRVYNAIRAFCRQGLPDPREKEFHKYWADSLRGGMFWFAQSSGKAECRIDRLREAPERKDCEF